MRILRKTKWIILTLLGSAVFALGFALFLEPNEINTGGISGLAMVMVKLTGVGTVGLFSILMNIPLFLIGGLKIGKRFFFGSLIGMLVSSALIDAFAMIPFVTQEPLVGGFMAVFSVERELVWCLQRAPLRAARTFWSDC